MVFSVLVPSSSSAAAIPESKLLAEYAIAGFRSGREKLRTGIVESKGQIDRSQEAYYPIKGSLEILYVFDFARRAIRFEQQQPVWISGPDGQESVLKDLEARSIMAQEYSVQWKDGMSLVKIRESKAKMSRQNTPFDIRLMGAVTWGTLDHGITFDSFTNMVVEQESLSANVSEEGVYEVAWVWQPPFTKSIIWFDSKRDFVPVRYEIRTRSSVNEEWQEPHEFGVTQWTQENDVWVPVSSFQQEDSKNARRRDFEFSWQEINARIDESLFKWQTLGLPESVSVYDARLGRPVRISRTDIEPRLGSTDSRVWPLVYVNALIVFCLAVVVLCRRFIFLRLKSG